MGRRSTAVRSRREEREAAAKRGCLFCRKSDGGFKSKEHVFPESLGNQEIIIDPGVVCDRCNNGTLSQLDQTICDFMPIQARQMMLGVRSKGGKVPRTRWQEGTIDYQPPDVAGGEPKLIVRSNGGNQILREKVRHPDGRVEFEWNASGGRKLIPRYISELSRAMLKSAFECAWLDHGPKVYEQRYDGIRNAILGAPHDGFLTVARKGFPDQMQVSLTYDFVHDADATRLWTWVDYYGILLATDSALPKSAIDVPEELLSTIAFTAAELS